MFHQFSKQLHRKQFLAKTQTVIMEIDEESNSLDNGSIFLKLHVLKLIRSKLEKLIEDGKPLIEKKEVNDEVNSILEYLKVMQDENKKLIEATDYLINCLMIEKQGENKMFNQFKEQVKQAKGDANDLARARLNYSNEIGVFVEKINLGFEYLTLMADGEHDDVLLALKKRGKEITTLMEKGESLIEDDNDSDNAIKDTIEALEHLKNDNQHLIAFVENTKMHDKNRNKSLS